MKKKALPLLMAMLCMAITVVAQNKHQSITNQKPLLPLLRQDLGNMVSAQVTANKGTSLMERIVGTAIRDNMDRLIDSIRYEYNMVSHGSTLINSNFDTYLPVFFDPVNSELTPGFWDNVVPASMFDTAFLYAYDTLGILQVEERHRVYYNTNDAPASLYINGYDDMMNPIYQERNILGYGGSGELITVKHEIDTSAMLTGGYLEDDRLNIDYAGTQRIQDSTSAGAGTLTPDQRRLYAYNVAGLLASKTVQNWNTLTSAWENGTYYTYTYDASDRITGSQQQEYNTVTTTYDNQYLDSFDYSASSNLPIYHSTRKWNAITMTWDDFEASVYTIAGGGASYTKLQQYEMVGPTLSPSYQYVFTSTPMDHISTIDIYNYDPATSGFTDYGGEYRWYYESVDPTAVSNIASSDKDYTLYPVPAGNKLTIDHLQGEVTVEIYNMSGQLLMQQHQNATGNMALNIEALPAGTYFASIKEGNSNTQIKFVKK